MAELIGVFKVRGVLDNTSFYPHKNGKCIIRKRRRSNPEKFHNDPRYERCRENVSEFSIASKAASQVRSAFSTHSQYLSDSNYYNRLVGLLRMIAETDTDPRGQRDGLEGNTHLLEGFSFNKDRSFADVLDAGCTAAIDHETGLMTLDIDTFKPLANVTAPAGARFFQVIIKGAAIGGGGKCKDEDVSRLYALDSTEPMSLSLSIQLNFKPGELLMMGAGVIFYEEYMGVLVPMRGGAFSILTVERNYIKDDTPDLPPRPDKATQLATLLDNLDQFYKSERYQPFGSPITGHSFQYDRPAHNELLKKIKRKRWLDRLEKYRKG